MSGTLCSQPSHVEIVCECYLSTYGAEWYGSPILRGQESWRHLPDVRLVRQDGSADASQDEA